jgi:hypothetical protein
MGEIESESEYKDAFIERVKAARIATGMKQWQIAEALGMPQDKYKQYESRSLIPHHLMGRFCIICRVEPDWLVTGKGQKPLKPPHIVDQAPAKPIPKPKRTKRHKAA